MNDFEVHPIGTAQRLAELERDAARYRWLRCSSVGPSKIWELISDDCHPPQMTLKSMQELDAAIDAAMGEAK